MTDQEMEIMIAAQQTDSGWMGAFRVVIKPDMDSIVRCETVFDTESEALQHAREHADEYTKVCVFLGILDSSVMLVDFSTLSQN